MGTTIEEVLELADVEKCLRETGAESTHNHCHNACVWLIVQIKRANLSDYNICWCVGTFWGRDHSWLVVQDTETDTEAVVDMTVNQFVNRPVPHSGPMTDEYEVHDSALLCDPEKLEELIGRAG